MKQSLVTKLLKRSNDLEPPGCCSTFVEHPFPGYRKRACVPVGFVIEHRFAFFYWIKRKQELLTDQETGTRWKDNEFSPPDLITWDWHDDFGCESDYIESELKQLNQTQDQEVALFCWAGLRPLNDGHIAPAVWLNALGNVYILQKQRDDCESENRVIHDRYGKPHHVYYFRSPDDLAETFVKTNSQSGVIWDIDLDYFTQEIVRAGHTYTPSLSSRQVRALLSPHKTWMQIILADLKAITIALEPKYTGGMSRSLALYSIWERALFDVPLFRCDCKWKPDLFEI